MNENPTVSLTERKKNEKKKERESYKFPKNPMRSPNRRGSLTTNLLLAASDSHLFEEGRRFTAYKIQRRKKKKNVCLHWALIKRPFTASLAACYAGGHPAKNHLQSVFH
ncbi:hypothetical protein CDAR_77901 [Caerostris darwini]|uniref:Uncharacterized protein n=1 Tax=Caerostris darwini TaxID=1538125 RepID=A0AAV4NDE1_9ARAC|nr:hypothetical protein CDAR_77901 [Caerostris darwini]